MSLSVSTHGRSRAVSTAIVPEPRDNDIGSLVDSLRLLANNTGPSLLSALEESTVLQQLRHILKDDNDVHSSKGGYRRVGGHQVLLRLIESAVAALDGPTSTSCKDVLRHLRQLLGVLSASLEGHTGNQKFFRSGPLGDGWERLQKALDVLGQQLSSEPAGEYGLEQLMGLLLSSATSEESLADIYTSFARGFAAELDETSQIAVKTVEAVHQKAETALTVTTELALPEFVVLQAHLWQTCKHDAIRVLDVALPLSIKVLLTRSRHNLVAAHLVGLSAKISPTLFSDSFSSQVRLLWKEIAALLYYEGASDLDEAGHLFARARSKPEAASFLLDAIKNSRRPSSIQFDLTTSGYSSIELSSLGRSFPPTETAGYTLSIWARFDEFDTNAHTTIFGAFDRSQSCFVLIYLEKDTHHMILQTAVRGSRPSIRFKSVAFEQNHWYHIGLVHKRPRTTSSSKAYLFIDGEFVEQQKANYPLVPPTDKGQRLKVQSFFGTPHDLSPASNGGRCTSKWSLASATLVSDALSDDIMAVFYNLGPQYHGNFQDCLGSFQTYKASAALNLRNEMLHPGKEDNSELILAIRQRASDLIAEERILLSISPAAILDSDDRNNVDESQLIRSLSKLAAKNLLAYTRAGSNAVAINGAVPAINDALTQARGVAMLMGDPTVAVPQPLEDASWRLGGCAPIGLGLVASASTTEDLALAVDILFETIRSSWRNSEVMERERGYDILAMLLRSKLAHNTDASKAVSILPTAALDRPGLYLKILGSILDFVGYDSHQREQSVINNPLAYKVLLVDCNIWRCGPTAVQELYFEQFQTFAAVSVHSRFNSKRLARMRVLKRLLEALKSEPVTKPVMQSYAETFRILLPQAITAELLRSMALFVTYAVNKRHLGLPTRKPTRRSTRPRQGSNPSPSRHTEEQHPFLTHFEIGMEVLRLYSEALCAKDDESLIKRFAKTVTNKWLLYLLSETSPEVVVLSMRILARLLVVHGDSYVKKFKDRTGGFVIMEHRLKRWWHLPALWPCCFAILFDVDVAQLDLDRPFDLFGFVEMFNSKKELAVVHPAMLEVITSMLQSGLKAIVSTQQHSQSGLSVPVDTASGSSTPQRLSMSTMAPPNPLLTIVTPQHIDTFNTVLRFLSDLHIRSSKFRDFAASSSYVQCLLTILFPVVVGSDIVDASTELDARDSTLTFDGSDVVVQPLSSSPPIVRTSSVEAPQVSSRGKTLRRGSSFVLVTKEQQRKGSSTDLQRLVTPASPMAQLPQLNEGHTIVQSLLEIIVAVFIDQIVARKDFPGLGLFLRTPPGFVEHQSYFESWILRNTVSQLSNHFGLNQRLLSEPKVLTNLARLFSHFGEALFEGWFIGGAEPVLDLSGSVLEYLQRPDIASLKSVRLCSQAIGVIRAVVFRTVLLTLSQLHDEESLAFLEKLSYWQNVLLSTEETQSTHLQLICYLLYASLVSSKEAVRNSAANFWRIILVQKPTEAAAILGQADTAQQKRLVSSFEKLVELDNETFLYWIDEHREELDTLFFETLSRTWDRFVAEENKRTEEGARGRITRRREKLKAWAREESDRSELIRRHEITFDHWTTNIFSSEHLKHQRLLQDFQDDLLFAETSFAKMQRDTSRPAGVFADGKPRKWRLDQTEGRNRMRMRLHEDYNKEEADWQPRRKGTDTPTTAPSLSLDTKIIRLNGVDAVAATPVGPSAVDSPVDGKDKAVQEPFPDVQENGDDSNVGEVDDSFELIEDPNADLESHEDKNRKVMRSLHRGDQVKHVANISRILGLEAVEGLLILGKDHIYLMDNFFQRADGEIVNVWQAPQEERDTYIRMISGKDVKIKKTTARDNEHEVRSWKWSEVISVSKRRFLFRDVAIEIFFGDGRSYLLTVISPIARNDLHNLINAKAPQFGAADSPQSEFAWRYETLKSVEDEPQGFGSRFANVFNHSPVMTATKKWQKGELSNFHYLMLVNTLAGRTYNDLTQYPVFPWVISDYTSEELDLNDPKSFRDLSKPMGCQTPEREAEFRDRYKSFAEMSDENTPAFHYGTHYSSAMIVTSYLIRLQPFVKSYLLLQGGSFDHPDRLFFSIEGAWRSAARMNMTDVRELTPEFFYLPEFLVNLNDFDFGKRQNTSKSVGTVELPPWAKGDPKIFIAKNREALESPHVSKNLHHWIDLIFGFKQKSDAAIEAVNVFHHLSYQGAKDLDAITDPMERLATIGIIHNFGQTPYQVFHRPHPAREQARHKYKRLDTAAESLTRLPSTLLDSEDRVASLTYSWKGDKLLCSGPFRINMPTSYDYYMEWGFSDNSVRFYSADSRKQVGLFEHLHIGQLSCAIFADSKTLITAGTDCTIAVWTIYYAGNKHIELHPKATLFGHRKPATVLALSRSFNALFTASASGELMLWDLNRCEFVRRIDSSVTVQCACVNDVTGNIVLCHGSQISIYTINGDLLLQQDSGDRSGENIVSCACYEGAGNEWLERDIIFTGHRHGVVRVWNKVVHEGKFELELIRQLNHVDATRGDGGNVSASITCILAMPQVVYTGDEEGKVYEWNCVQRH